MEGLPVSCDTEWCNEPWVTKAVRIAWEVIDNGNTCTENPFMIHSSETYNGNRILYCMCFYHTVMFHEKMKIPLLFTNEAGGGCPILMEYFDTEGFWNRPEFDFEELWLEIETKS